MEKENEKKQNTKSVENQNAKKAKNVKVQKPNEQNSKKISQEKKVEVKTKEKIEVTEKKSESKTTEKEEKTIIKGENSEKEKTTEEIENTESQKEMGEKILGTLKTIFLAITSVIWFPWKVLFVKKEGNKFKDVSTGKKIFRIVRAPITKTIKFAIYLCIIGLEVLVVYKLRYSSLTYPLTRSSVQNHYLSAAKDDTSPEYKESLKQAFAHIDEWDLDSKNKMYVIFDSDIMKMTFQYTSEESLKHILDKFNDDEEFREDLHYTAQNIDSVLSRAIKEFPETLDDEELEAILEPITTVGSTFDYRMALDLAGSVSDMLMTDEDIEEGSLTFSFEEIDLSLDVINNYARGMSLEEAYYRVNDANK